MSEYANPPISPSLISLDVSKGSLLPSGPTLTRRLSDLEGCFKNKEAWQQEVNNNISNCLSSNFFNSSRNSARITTIDYHNFSW